MQTRSKTRKVTLAKTTASVKQADKHLISTSKVSDVSVQPDVDTKPTKRKVKAERDDSAKKPKTKTTQDDSTQSTDDSSTNKKSLKSEIKKKQQTSTPNPTNKNVTTNGGSKPVKRKKEDDEQPDIEPKKVKTTKAKTTPVKTTPVKTTPVKTTKAKTTADTETKKKKRRKKRSDGAWNKRSGRKGSKKPINHTNMVSMRALNDKKFENEKGEEVAVKTTLMIENVIFPANYDLNVVKSTIASKLTDGTYRPIGWVELSAKNSPRKVFTPDGKTQLVLVAKYGPGIYMFSNHPSHIPFDKHAIQKKVDSSSEYWESDIRDSLRENTEEEKIQTAEITTKSLQKARKEIDENAGKRICSQNKCMVEDDVSQKKGSANQLADELDLLKPGNKKWEWLHMVAHKIWANKAQTDENLIGGSYHANTAMLFPEGQIEYLAEKYPQGFELEVISRSMEGENPDGEKELTQMGTTVDYNIKTKDFTLHLVFNAQEPNQPHVSFNNYFNALTQTLVECSDTPVQQNKSNLKQATSSSKAKKHTPDTNPTAKVTMSPGHPNCFTVFSRSTIREESEEQKKKLEAKQSKVDTSVKAKKILFGTKS